MRGFSRSIHPSNNSNFRWIPSFSFPLQLTALPVRKNNNRRKVCWRHQRGEIPKRNTARSEYSQLISFSPLFSFTEMVLYYIPRSLLWNMFYLGMLRLFRKISFVTMNDNIICSPTASSEVQVTISRVFSNKWTV